MVKIMITIMKVFLCKGTRQKPFGILRRLKKSSGIDLISQCRFKLFQLSVVKIFDELNFYAQISTAKPLWSSGKTLATNAGNRGLCRKSWV